MDCIVKCCPVPSAQTVASSYAPRHYAPSFENIKIVPLGNPALLAYLKERGIPAHIAKANCKEAHYTLNGRPYFAVAFPNISSGVELRNRYFKGCISPKDISIRRIRDGPSTECAVFEGFIDYLSALALGIIGTDVIILNSVSNVHKAIPHLRDYNAIHCYLDNDVAGKKSIWVS